MNSQIKAEIKDLITTRAALGEVLAAETDFMDKMQLEKVNELQDRKLKLISLLERYMNYIHHNQEAIKNITPQEKADLIAGEEYFNKIARKNYDTLLVAKSVNGALVKCVTKSQKDKKFNPTYNYRGAANSNVKTSISITLNQTI